MEIKFVNQNQEPLKLKTFLSQQKISRRLLAKIKYAGGTLLVNKTKVTVRALLYPGDEVKLILPPEKNRQHELIASYVPIDILYEDADFLVVQKPAHVASIPSILHSDDSLINRVYGYYKLKNYQGILPHIVTRLDRDTSGLVLFAKHRYAHALLDEQLRNHQVKKTYLAILSGHIDFSSKEIIQPIARCHDSTMKRQVDKDGQYAHTSLKVIEHLVDATVCLVQLHTGRTHQIRVHCAYLNHPLIGDSLYGGQIKMPLQRQALHCHQLTFYHPFKQKIVTFTSLLPYDMQMYLKKERRN